MSGISGVEEEQGSMKWGIRKKLIIFLMLATILPFGTAIGITYYQTTTSINDQFVSTNHDLITKGEQELTVYLEDIAQMSTVLYRYEPLMSVMREGISGDLARNQEEIRRALAYLFNTRPEIEQMHLYIDKEKDSFINYHSTISGRGEYKNILSHPYYAELPKHRDFYLIEPPHEIYSYNNMAFIPKSQSKKVLSFHNIIRDVPAETVLGFLSIDINLSRIGAIADRLYTKDAEELFIVNDQGIVVYSSNEEVIGKPMGESWFDRIKKEPASAKSLEWEEGVIVFDQFSGPVENWYIAKRIPYDVLYQMARQTAYTNIIIGMVTLVFVLFATMFVSFKITAPIKVLITNMKKVEKGEFKADFESFGNDEIGMLGKHFKSMIEKINELIEREYRLDIENKASQLRVLRSQINPHFLYNSLQSIGTLALKANGTKVYTLLTSLAGIMRYSMNMKEDIVPLSHEIRHVKSYLQLQKQRFDDQLNFHLDIQKETEGILVPKMILQPIVENCFKHGFDQHTDKQSIMISASIQENGMLQIRVKDNGTGVTDEKLIQIRHELYNGSEKTTESIGLKNIYDRLVIYYRGQAEFSIFKNGEEGFVVSMEIPVEIPKEGNSL
jgi:two-component system, sensor histidine kinase YesM